MVIIVSFDATTVTKLPRRISGTPSCATMSYNIVDRPRRFRASDRSMIWPIRLAFFKATLTWTSGNSLLFVKLPGEIDNERYNQPIRE